MKVKFISKDKGIELEEEINKFIEGKKVIDIKFSPWDISDEAGVSSGFECLILYEEEE